MASAATGRSRGSVAVSALAGGVDGTTLLVCMGAIDARTLLSARGRMTARLVVIFELIEQRRSSSGPLLLYDRSLDPIRLSFLPRALALCGRSVVYILRR